MHVTIWQDNTTYSMIDDRPLPNDVTVDIPKNIIDRYHRILDEWLDVQAELEYFSREQERSEEYERLR